MQHAIDELGYHPHAGARALASRRSSVLALVHPLRPELRLPMRMVLSVVTSARAHDHDVLLLTGDEGPQGMRRVARSALVDGFVLMDVELYDERVGVLRELGLPGVLIGVPAHTEGLTCVDLDFEAAAALCVDHLAELGHREVVLIGEAAEVYRRGSGFANRSLDGFTRRAAELGLAASHYTCDGSPEQVEAPLLAHPAATAFVVHNTLALRPVLDALRTRGRAVRSRRLRHRARARRARRRVGHHRPAALRRDGPAGGRVADGQARRRPRRRRDPARARALAARVHRPGLTISRCGFMVVAVISSKRFDEALRQM